MEQSVALSSRRLETLAGEQTGDAVDDGEIVALGRAAQPAVGSGLETAAAALRTALAEDSPEWKAKFKGVIDSCKACHKTFRAEKKK